MQHKKPLFTAILFSVCFLLFCFSSFKLFSYTMKSREAEVLREKMMNSVIVSIPSEESEPITKEDSLLSSKFPDIQVDISKIQKMYPNAVAWLYCPDTPIHYPVMRTDNNEYYVNHLPNGSENSSGSIFLDYRSDLNLSGFGQVLYGHNMKNRSMFGSLLDYRKVEYYQKHPYMFYFTSDSVYRLELFAGVHTTANNELYRLPVEISAREAYLNRVKKASVFQSDVLVAGEDQILLLSTCSGSLGDDKRFVLLGKLVLLEQ